MTEENKGVISGTVTDVTNKAIGGRVTDRTLSEQELKITVDDEGVIENVIEEEEK